MMKTIFQRLFFMLLFLTILFVLYLAYLDKVEWTYRNSQKYEINLPLNITNGTFAEIESQVRKEVLKKQPDSYLCQIYWLTNSNDGFEKFSNGEMVFTYCRNLGNLNGYYKYERFVQCVVVVNLYTRKIVDMNIYGNYQIGGLEKLISYPEVNEIRSAVLDCVKDIEPNSKVVCSSVNIDCKVVETMFEIKTSEGDYKKFKGEIKKSGGIYKFYGVER